MGKEGIKGTRCTLREGRGHMQMQWGSHLRRQGEIQDKACRWQHRLQQWRIWRPGPRNRESMLLQRRQEGEEEAKEEGKEGKEGNEGTRCTLREGRGHMQMQWGSHLRR